VNPLATCADSGGKVLRCPLQLIDARTPVSGSQGPLAVEAAAGLALRANSQGPGGLELVPLDPHLKEQRCETKGRKESLIICDLLLLLGVSLEGTLFAQRSEPGGVGEVSVG